jgi:hypothetical protein
MQVLWSGMVAAGSFLALGRSSCGIFLGCGVAELLDRAAGLGMATL